MKRTPLKRKSGLKRTGFKRRSKPQYEVTKDGRVILRGEKYTELRWKKCQEAGGKCQHCGKSTPFYKTERGEPLPRWAGQLCHWPPKKMGNSQGSDTLETTLWLCSDCHDKLDKRNMKVVPKKVPPLRETAHLGQQKETP